MINPAFTYRVKEATAIDGDTVDLLVDLGFYSLTRQRFRLARINAEETNSSDPIKRAQGREAKRVLAEWLAAAKTITVVSQKTEKYGRWLAELYIDVLNVSDMLVSAGLAAPYDGGNREP